MSLLSSFLTILTGKGLPAKSQHGTASEMDADGNAIDGNAHNDNDNENSQALAHAYAEITTVAAPGLMTLLDTALFKTYEGQLTATVSSANATLHAFFELKHQSKLLLQACISSASVTGSMSAAAHALPTETISGSGTDASSDIGVGMDAGGGLASNLHLLESFARHCIACSTEAIVRITTDKLAETANLPPADHNPKASSSSSSSNPNTNPSSSQEGGGSSFDYDLPLHDPFSEIISRLSLERQHQIRTRDCWESKRLHCVDYVWGDEAVLQCQRLVRAMMRYEKVDDLLALHAACTATNKNICIVPKEKLMKPLENIMILLKHDLPMRLRQFRHGVESDIVVSKRLYLIKNEYRAPFRSFLEGHMLVRRAPSLELVMEYIRLHSDDTANSNSSRKSSREKNRRGARSSMSKNSDTGTNTSTSTIAGEGDAECLKDRKMAANQKIQDCLRHEKFVQIIRLEELCEGIEASMASILLPFSDLARLLLDGRRQPMIRLGIVPGVLDTEQDVLRLREVLRRLKGILCRNKTSSGAASGKDGETSIGIRPLLLDVQGIPRNSVGGAFLEFDPFGPCRVTTDKEKSRDIMIQRLQVLCEQLRCIYDTGKACKFGVEKKDMEALPAAIGACANFNSEKFSNLYTEWYDFSAQQRELAKGGDGEISLDELSQNIRKAEIEVSIANASSQALTMVRQRIEHIELDRKKRFEILKEMVEECCLREMDIRLTLIAPDKGCVLKLPYIKSAPGLFQPALDLAGEKIASC